MIDILLDDWKKLDNWKKHLKHFNSMKKPNNIEIVENNRNYMYVYSTETSDYFLDNIGEIHQIIRASCEDSINGSINENYTWYKNNRRAWKKKKDEIIDYSDKDEEPLVRCVIWDCNHYVKKTSKLFPYCSSSCESRKYLPEPKEWG